MKTLVVRIAIALLLFVSARAFSRAAEIEDSLATAQEQLTTLRAGATLDRYDEVERSLAVAARLPVVGDALLADVREQRAAAMYWRADYAALIAEQSDEDEDAEPLVMYIATNARYRDLLVRQPEEAVLIRGLDDLLTRYQDLLTVQPGHVDAAYNFEFVARLRDAVARGRAIETMVESTPNMHGEEGEPPEGTKTPDFNVIVPMRPEERQDQFDAGVGGVERRQG